MTNNAKVIDFTNKLIDRPKSDLKKDLWGIDKVITQSSDQNQSEDIHDILKMVSSILIQQRKCSDCPEKEKHIVEKKGEIIMNTKKVLLGYFTFLTASILFMAVSLTLYLLYRFADIITFNPKVLFVLTLMGLGWSMTAFFGIKSVGGKNGTI